MKIIMDNGGVDMDSLTIDSLSRQGNTDIIRQYLKNKENELQESLSTNKMQGKQQIAAQPTKKGTIKPVEQMKKSKELVYNQSKTALSKRVAELERKTKEDEKKFENIRHKFEQTNQEKELYKRQLDTVKQKLKTQEIQDVRNSKISSNEDIPQINNNIVGGTSKSPRQMNKMQQQQSLDANDKKIITLQRARKDRKMKKMERSENEPRVIADEPMEDEEEDESTVTILDKR